MEDGVGPVCDRATLVGPRNEVGDAGKDDHVGLAADILQRLGQDGEMAARQHLAAGHCGITTVRVIHVALDVRVAK